MTPTRVQPAFMQAAVEYSGSSRNEDASDLTAVFSSPTSAPHQIRMGTVRSGPKRSAETYRTDTSCVPAAADHRNASVQLYKAA